MAKSKALVAITLIGISVILFGCVSTPEPNPVAAVQPGDDEMPCEYLRAEYKGNTEAAARKTEKNNAGDLKDAAIGILIWPGLADFNNASGHEGNTLLDRNTRLKSLAEVKECDTFDWPEQHERY
jgi:hypothetical protein